MNAEARAGMPRIVIQFARFLASAYLLGFLLFSFMRMALLVRNLSEAREIPGSVLLRSILVGSRFDLAVCSYMILVPFALSVLACAFGWRGGLVPAILTVSFCTEYVLGAFIAGIDIGYYGQFNTRVTVSVLNWLDNAEFVVRMVVEDRTFHGLILLFGASTWLLCFLLWRFGKKLVAGLRGCPGDQLGRRLFQTFVMALCGSTFLILTIRGRTAEKSPIRWGTAFFSEYAFANQLPLNPVFTFVESWMETRGSENRLVEQIDSAAAIRRVQEALEISAPDTSFSPIARHIAAGEPTRQNLVLVVMESMAAWKMARFGNENRLTPYLDGIAARGYCFDRLYSSGMHTYSGLYSTLCGLPVVLQKHAMKGTDAMQPFGSIARVLARHDYHTVFFSTHDDQFDNMGGFLRNAGFQRVVSLDDYPAEWQRSTLGVPDHYMFQYALPALNQLSAGDRPFFATLLTASDHGPYVVPPAIGFSPQNLSIEKTIVEYADWSIGEFMKAAARQPWFENTIFAFVADHGTIHLPRYDLALSLFHVPFVIYSKGLESRAETLDQLGCQFDVAPTLLGLLNTDYINNSLGIDLLRDRRPMAFFSGDDKLGCLDEERYLIVRTGNDTLYHYPSGDIHDFSQTEKPRAEAMRVYVLSMMRTAQWLVSQGRARPGLW
ncbi:MAG: sulfatase-like hydrolase/transferase [Acidobacteriota bacterium]